jgi:hypothetical protein
LAYAGTHARVTVRHFILNKHELPCDKNDADFGQIKYVYANNTAVAVRRMEVSLV